MDDQAVERALRDAACERLHYLDTWIQTITIVSLTCRKALVRLPATDLQQIVTTTDGVMESIDSWAQTIRRIKAGGRNAMD